MRSLLFLLPCLLLWGIGAFADNLTPEGNFESPFIKGRTPLEAGGDPSNGGRGPGWISFHLENTGNSGKIIAGLTDEIARNGKQSLYIRFDHVAAPYQAAVLVSNMIPVVSGTQYQVGIWGRTDAKDLVTAEGRPAVLKLQVDFFAKDGNTSVPNTFYSIQPIPGVKGHDAYFTPDKWNRFYVRLTTPPGAVFAQITWRWETSAIPGATPGGKPDEINGIMYFDDSMMLGPAAPNPDLTPSP